MTTRPETITLRWTSVRTYLGCQRRYDLAFRQQLVRQQSSETRARILGSHVHAGIAAALEHAFYAPAGTAPSDLGLVTAAVGGARQYNQDQTETDKKVYDHDTRTWRRDEDYYLMMRDVLVQAIAILRYQVPRIGLGTRYRVPSVAEVITNSQRDTLVPSDQVTSDYRVPMIEWTFAESWVLENGNPYILTGTIDTVLQDIETGEYIIWDWKTRQQMPQERLIDLDGQLKLYAAVLNRMGARITRACQYQIRDRVPQPVKLTDKKGKISTANILTTWEVWSEDCRRMGEDPEKYREVMMPKMHPPEDFTRPVLSLIHI